MVVRAASTSRPSRWSIALGFVSCVLVASNGEPASDLVAFGVAAIWFFVALLCAVPVLHSFHELSHALVGKLMGAEVFGITLGSGRLLCGFEVGSVFVEVRESLSGGRVILRPTGRRWRDAAIYSAGVGFEAMVVVGMLLWQPGAIALNLVRWAVFGIAALDIIVNAIPRSTGVGTLVEAQSDGARILAIVTDPSAWRREVDEIDLTPQTARLTQLIHGGDLAGAIPLAEQRLAAAPDDVEGIETLGLLLLLSERWRAAYETLAELADASDAAPVVQNNAAWAAVMTFDPSLLAHADRLSEQAFLHAEPTPAITNTRGATLTMSGRSADGLALLEAAAQSDVLTPGEGAFVAAFTALALDGVGDHQRAAEQFALANSLDADCPALSEIEARMSGPLAAV